MNKAFTANINDQVTARGYLDENNQLIMLEPEGSGGGGEIGDFKLATCTLSGFSSGDLLPGGSGFVYVLEDAMTIADNETFFNGMQIVVYGETPTEIEVNGVENCVFSGDCEFTPGPGGGVLAVTGDFTITKGA